MELLLIILSFIAYSNKYIFIDINYLFLSIQIDTCCRPVRNGLRPAKKKTEKKSFSKYTYTVF